ncbi:MAG: hypothetical protein U1E83_09660 [Methylotetracoccus sp.]
MLQVVAGLTVAFVGYVLYEVFKTVSQVNTQSKPAKTPAKRSPKAVTPPSAEVPAVAEPEAVVTDAEPAPAASTPTEAVADASDDKAVQLRNPTTGETCPFPTNYRFAKKWVKEALVAEQLLDRIYKANELDDKGSQEVKAALEQLRAMPKYHG